MSASKAKSRSTSPKTRGKKVMRIAVVHAGTMVDERRLKKRETISIGKDPKKPTFSVNASHLPSTFDVFVHKDGRYFLRFTDDMDGRVQRGKDAVLDFKRIKRNEKPRKDGDAYIYPIDDGCRGKVIIGDVTMLFKFVDPPMAPGRVDLPVDVRGSFLSSIDIQFSSIFVVTALAAISVVSYATNQPYVSPSSIEQISERYQKLIMPDRVPEPPKELTEKAADTGKDESKKKPVKKKKSSKKSKSSKKTGKKVSAEEAARARKAAITKKVAGKGLLAVIGTKGEGAGALADVFKDGDASAGDLGNAFSGIQGVDIAESGGAVGTRGGGSGEAASIGDIATEGGGNVRTGRKVEAKVAGRVASEAPSVDGELDTNAVQRAMRKYLSGVKDCYERALKRNPTLRGKIVIGFEVTERGKVSEFSFPKDSVDSAEVRRCIKSRSRSWRFPRPDGGPVYVEFPLVFEPSNG